MGSMVKADSERRELVRERRQARIERKQQRRQAREDKHVQMGAAPAMPSAIQRAAQEKLDSELDRIVSQALVRHDHMATAASRPELQREAGGRTVQRIDVAAPADRPAEARGGAPMTHRSPAPIVADQAAPAFGDGEGRSRRERDIAAFGERRRQVADEARAEARRRIARLGEPACVADALSALAHPSASPWQAERQRLEQALAGGRIVEVGAVARRALWEISRDAARSSRRARRDPDLALAACVAYAIIARLPRTALRSTQRTRPAPTGRPIGRRRAFRR